MRGSRCYLKESGLAMTKYTPGMEKNDSDLLYSYQREASLVFKRALIRAPLKPHKHHCTMVSRGLRGAPKIAHILPGDASLSDSRCTFFQKFFTLCYTSV